MIQNIMEILLWLFVVNLGIAFGAGIYEARIIVPQWASSPPESVLRWNAESTRRPDPGRRFWAFITTFALTPLSVANLVAAWQAQDPMKSWWLGAAVAIVVERVATLSYFIPTMLKLQRAETLPESKVRAMASQWVRLNYVRNAVVLAAWVAALKAFSLPHSF